jgi:muramoyltetrapeptide carboxypeptidase
MTQRSLRIGIVGPGRAIDRELAERVSRLAEGAAELVFHPQCFLREGHFAGPDSARAAAFVDFANDPSLDAVWFARGGYGACRILDAALRRLGPPARAKTYLGYSDAGSLLAGLARGGVGRVVHGPMPADILRDGGEAAVSRSLAFLTGRDAGAGIDAAARAPGKYAAFNISVLASLIGTGWLPDLTGHVLMLEDVGEYHYRLDRMMFTITSNPEVRKVAGIRLGRCGAIPVNDIDFGRSEEEIVQDWCARGAIAYLGRADIGHDADNKIVVFGERGAGA